MKGYDKSDIVCNDSNSLFKKIKVLIVGDAVLERNVEGIVSSFALADVILITTSGKISGFKLVDREGEHLGREGECVLHAVT